MDLDSGRILNYGYYEIDTKTGATRNREEFPVVQWMFMYCTYHPELQRVYGYMLDFNSDSPRYVWASATTDALDEPESDYNVVSSHCYAMTYCHADGQIYGVNTKNQFVRIALDGTQTVLCTLPNASSILTNYFAGLCWNEGSKKFYFNANYSGNTSAILSITPDGKTVETEYQLPDAAEFSYMYTVVNGALPNQPYQPTVGAISFPDGSLSGTVTYTLPSYYGNGTTIDKSAEMTYTATLDGSVYNGAGATGTGHPGDKITVDYTTTQGLHAFGIYVTLDGENSPRGYRATYIGNDTPEMPTEVVLAYDKISWNPVTTGTHKGYIDTNAMEYEVTLNGQVLGTTSNTYYDIKLDGEGELTGYVATVTPKCHGLVGKTAESNHLVYGEPYYLENGYYIAPTEQQWEQCTTVDGNKNGATWEYDPKVAEWNGEENCFSIMWTKEFDDYLFLPPVYIDASNKYYKLSFRCADGYQEHNATLDVIYATAPTPDAKVGTILDPYYPKQQKNPGFKRWDLVEGYMHVEESGVYYIGFHAYATDGNGLYVNAISLEPSDVTPVSPRAMDVLNVSAAGNGQNKATVALIPSDYMMDGTRFPDNTTIYANAVVNGKPATYNGEPLGLVPVKVPLYTGDAAPAFYVDTEQSGNYGTIYEEKNMIEVNLVNIVDGVENPGPISRAEVYTGYGYPAIPQGLEATVLEDYSSVKMTWDRVTEGYGGALINPETVVYETFLYVELSGGMIIYWLDLLEEGDHIEGTEYTFNLLDVYDWISHISYEDAPQAWYSVGVQSSNEAGTSHYVKYVDVIMGKPYDLPYIDKFDNPLGMYGNATEMWIPYSQLDGVNRSGSWAKGELADGDLALLGRSPGGSGSGAIGIPVFSTLGMEDATITMSVRTGNSCPPFKLLFEHYGTYEYTVVGSFSPEGTASEFTDLTFELPAEYMNLPAVKIMIVPEYSSTSQQFWMNRISIDGTSSASVDSVNGNAGKIIGGNGVITLQGFGNEIVTVTAADGRIVAQTRATGDEANISVDKGIYIVTAGKKVAKVIVK